MRNLLYKSSIAQSLDGDRLMGSLHFPATVSRLSAAHPQQERNGSKYHEAVRAVFFRSADGHRCKRAKADCNGDDESDRTENHHWDPAPTGRQAPARNAIAKRAPYTINPAAVTKARPTRPASVV
jgi:hypothetical protein